MEFYFANGKKALVNIGSTLRLENTKLTAETTCTPTAMWNGVYLEGNPGVIQNTANQGTLSMAAGSEISNAITGVTVEGGAICKIYAGDFINNKTGIYFYPHTYSSLPNYNASFVQLANFTINGALNNGNTPLYMIYMNGVKGINITSSNFLNSRGSDIAAASRGYAIRSNSTNFKLSNCELEGWNYGCYSTLGTPRILNNEFAGNFKSVYSASGVSVEITGNDFDGDYNFASGTATPYSVHVLGNGTNNTLYKFEENTIQNGVVGVQFNNLGPNAVKVKDNTFINIDGYTQSCAAVAIGKNSNYINGSIPSYGQVGLEFRCNNFDNNPYALSVIDGNIRKYQGEQGASSGSDYAGNAFDHYGSNLERDFYVKIPINSYWEIPQYTYYNHTDISHRIDYYTTGPDPLNPKIVIGGDADFFQESDCEEGDGGGIIIIKSMSVAEGSEIIEQTDTELLLKEFELEEMIDEGNTFSLLSEVETMNSNNTIDVAESIAELDGFISDEVATTYMQNNSGNQFAKANALLANSPLPASVRGEIDEMDMSPSLKHVVKQHQNGSNVRDLKQSEIAGLKQYRGLLVNELVISAIFNDSVPSEKLALKQFLTNDENLQSKFHLFNLNILSKEYIEAHATLESIKQMIQIEDINYLAEMEDFIELQHIIVEIEAGNISIADAAANNLDLLNFIADEESYPGQATAQLILSQAGIREFEEVIKLPEPIIENKSIDIQKGNTDNFSTNDDIINVYPNPTAGNIYVEYAFLNNSDNGFIEIYGITGNLVYRTELSQPIGVFTYKEKLPAGNYIIKVGNDFSQKITIQ
ncbi:MAG: T9SS type A sorting domain-containing protein [Bacteroidales bacterium]|nr:T9SS type A sorting domain-containing protein [Bacteroidales bacterium]